MLFGSIFHAIVIEAYSAQTQARRSFAKNSNQEIIIESSFNKCFDFIVTCLKCGERKPHSVEQITAQSVCSLKPMRFDLVTRLKYFLSCH